MARSRPTVAELRKRCKNTLYVAGKILGMEELQSQVRLICTFCQPIHDQHSDNTVTARAPADVVAFYLGMARCSFLHPLARMCGRLTDMASLRLVGFHTSLEGLTGRKAEEKATVQRVLQHDDLLAEQAFRLVVCLLHARCKSCGWYCGSWPGLLALFASDQGAVQQEGLRLLRADWAASNQELGLAGASSFVEEMVKRSPLNTTVMREVCELAFQSPAVPEAEVLRQLRDLSARTTS